MPTNRSPRLPLLLLVAAGAWACAHDSAPRTADAAAHASDARTADAVTPDAATPADTRKPDAPPGAKTREVVIAITGMS